MGHTKEPWGVGNIKKTLVVRNGKRIAACGIDTPNQILEEQKENARRIVACVNYCEGVPTNELESNGADAGFWGRACARLEHKLEQAQEENATLRAAVKEMQRMLPVLEYFEQGEPIENDGDMLWADAILGTGIATANAYRQTLENALKSIKIY